MSMNRCPEHMITTIHAYFDGDLSHDEDQQLKEHLSNCSSCSELFNELDETVAFINLAEPIQAPEGFVEGVMAQLPRKKMKNKPLSWLRRHPILVAVSLFFILMSASLFSGYGNNQQFSVSDYPNLIVEGETVIVPEGEVINGDLIVENGELRVEGEVDGNVLVVNGSKYMASTAVVTGSSEEIDRFFSWLWYKIKQIGKDVSPSSLKKDQSKE